MAKKTYEEYLSDAGIIKPAKTDFQKDMDEYGGKLKAAMEASRIRNLEMAERRKAGMPEPETTVKTTPSDYAEAETKEAPKKARTAVDQKKQATTKKNSLFRTPVKAPNLKKPGSSTSEKDKEKGNSKEAAATPKKPAATPKKPAEAPKGGYKPENQGVKPAKEPRGAFKKGPLTIAIEEEHKRKQKALRAKWKKMLGIENLKKGKKATDKEGRNILG